MQIEGEAGTSVSFTLFGKEEPLTDASREESRAKVTYVPRVNAQPDRLQPTTAPFNKWWEEVVIKDKTGTLFSRRDLVLAMANQEGGAHVDPHLDEQYARLTRFNSQGWRVRTVGTVRPPDNSLVAANVRQIAHEVLVSIEQSFPDVCAEPLVSKAQ
jgi:hypothetical protein